MVVAAIAISTTTAADAHEALTGFAGFRGGVGLVLLPAPLLAILGAAAVAASVARLTTEAPVPSPANRQRPDAALRTAWRLFGSAFALGLAVALAGLREPLEPALYVVALNAGGAAALGQPVARLFAAPVAGAAGAATGLLALPTHGLPNAVIPSVAGSFVAATLLFAAAGVMARALRGTGERWRSLALRIAAAWLAAIAMLLLAVELAPPRSAPPSALAVADV